MNSPMPTRNKCAGKISRMATLTTAAAILAIVSPVFAVQAAKRPAAPTGIAQRPLGEPYELAGKRLVFVNRFFVRPGWWEKSRGFCYLESTDGVHWQRPELGQVEHAGRKTNLIDANFGEGCVFVDPTAPTAERYKSVQLNEMSYEDFEQYKLRRPDGWERLG